MVNMAFSVRKATYQDEVDANLNAAKTTAMLAKLQKQYVSKAE